MVTQARRAIVGRAGESVFLVLAPPYSTLIPFRSLDEGSAFPLGTVVVGLGDHPIDGLMTLTQLTYSCPWAIPCLVRARTHEPLEPLLVLLRELRNRLVVVTLPAGVRPKDEVATIVRSVRKRPLPTPAAMAFWVTQRLNNPALERPLRDQFAIAVNPTARAESPSIATYSRLFRRYGPYTARDWRAIARLCRHAQAGAVEEEDRAGMRLPLRTAMRYASKYLQASHHTVHKRIGWEWILEAALRVGGYVSG